VGDFFTAPIGDPLPPPEPDFKPPNFEQMSENLGIGLQKSGLVSGWLAPLFDILLAWVTAVIGFVLSNLIRFFAYLIGILGEATTDASAAYGSLVAATLKELFGIEVNPADVSTRVGGPARSAAAARLGNAVVNTMFVPAKPDPQGGIVPSSQGADTFLSVVMNMELNGWIESWVTDGLSGHLLEKYGDLKDGIAQVLGLGRLSRQVFRAPLKVLVSDPYMNLLEQKYRSRHWDVAAAVSLFNQQRLSREDLSKYLGNQGYTELQIQEQIERHQKYLSTADLDYLDQRGQIFGDFWQSQLMLQGYSESTAQSLIAMTRDKRVQKYRQEMITVGETAYVAGNIGPDTFATILQQSGVTQEEQNWIQQVADLKIAVKVRHLTEGEIIKGIEEGILNFTDLQTWAIREGVSQQDLATLELETQFQINKASTLAKTRAAAQAAKLQTAQAKLQLAKEKAAAAQVQADDKGLSAAQAATLVKDGIWTIGQYSAFLTSRGYGPGASQASVELLQAEIGADTAKKAAAAATKAQAAIKGLNLAQVEKAVIEGLLTSDQLMQYLTGHGYTTADAQIIVDLTENQLHTVQTKAAAKSAAEAKAASKSISLVDIERSVRLGLTTQAVYDAALKAGGFDDMSITLLNGILQSQIKADKEAAAKAAAAAAAASVKGVSLAQIEQEVIAGIRPIGDYSAELLKLNYSPADQQQLTALLQLKVDQALATAAKAAAAAAAASAKGISIADAERAVKLGVIPLAKYQALLASLHYTADAIDVLSNTLLAQIAATRKAQTSANNAAANLAGKSISLPDLEKAVIAGIVPIENYTTTLTANGYNAADAGTLTQLLQLKVDQAAQAAAAHADAVGLATQKGISLGKEEAAVIAGDLTMADYDSLLTALGYDDIDRAILEDLLQTKVTAAAAKAAATAPPAQ
jgi:hypothetical protein